MIKGTNADCKITKIEISETTATVSLLIYSTLATSPAKSFYIYIKDDDDSPRVRANNNIYWIDRINVYNNDTSNIDINKYKEIILKIDITKGNTSHISGNKRVRNCYIYISSAEDFQHNVAWSSDKLTLISEEFEIPEVKALRFETENLISEDDETKGNIGIGFNLSYKTEKDFNYNNKNISALINIKSTTTQQIIETIKLPVTSIENYILSACQYIYHYPVIIEIIITNNIGEILKTISKIYEPQIKRSNTFIKTPNGVRRAIAFYVAADVKWEHEGEWLYDGD